MLPFHFLQTHFNIFLPSTPTSSKWSLSPTFPTKILRPPLIFSNRATCHTHLIILYSITRKTFAEKQWSYSSFLCSFILSPVTLSFLNPNIFSASYSRTPLPMLLNVPYQNSHPYKAADIILALYQQTYDVSQGSQIFVVKGHALYCEMVCWPHVEK